MSIAKIVIVSAPGYFRLLDNLCDVIEAVGDLTCASREGITHCILEDILSGGMRIGSMKPHVFSDTKDKMDDVLEILDEQRETLRNELTQVMMKECLFVLRDASFIDNFALLGSTKSIAMRYLINDYEKVPEQRISTHRNWGIRRRGC